MDVDRLAGIPDRRGRVRVVAPATARQPPQPLRLVLLQPCAATTASKRPPLGDLRRRVSRFTPGDQLGRSGVITMRRKGSSPSLCVSTSGRSFR